jgi:hypothetical protein
VAEQDETVVVTSHNQPRVVLVRWETYQEQQQLQADGAQYRLQSLLTEMERVAASLQEAFRPHSLEVVQGVQELATLAHEAWKTSRFLDTPCRHLAGVLSDSLLNVMESGGLLTHEQLVLWMTFIPLLRQTNLTNEVVANADRTLAEAGLSSMFPVGSELVTYYQPMPNRQLK